MTYPLPLVVQLLIFVYLFGIVTGILAPRAWRFGKRLGERRPVGPA